MWSGALRADHKKRETNKTLLARQKGGEAHEKNVAQVYNNTKYGREKESYVLAKQQSGRRKWTNVQNGEKAKKPIQETHLRRNKCINLCNLGNSLEH